MVHFGTKAKRMARFGHKTIKAGIFGHKAGGKHHILGHAERNNLRAIVRPRPRPTIER